MILEHLIYLIIQILNVTSENGAIQWSLLIFKKTPTAELIGSSKLLTGEVCGTRPPNKSLDEFS